jgi:hypothetical protein
MFFKKGLKDLALIHKLAKKNPRTSEAMLAIANNYALAEDATLDNREAKKDKKLSHPDRPGASKTNGKKRKNDRSVANVERPCHSRTEYRPRPGDYEDFLDGICIFHLQEKHKTRHCNHLQGFVDEVLKLAKKAEQEKKIEDLKCDFSKARKEVNYIFGGPNSYESKTKQKLTAREVMTVGPATPEYLKWFEVPVTFDQSDHSDFVPKLSRYPLIISPIIKDVKLNRVLVDGGSSLNILFLKTFDQMGLPRSALRSSRAPFHGIVPGAAATPVGQITLPMMFGTRENFHTKYIQFEVADFETAYNAFLRRLALTKFMVIPHYAYLVLKMQGSNGVISIRGDVK